MRAVTETTWKRLSSEEIALCLLGMLKETMLYALPGTHPVVSVRPWLFLSFGQSIYETCGLVLRNSVMVSVPV